MVGLYAIVLVGMVVAGPAWVWVLPIALAGQCLLLAVYSELSSQFPISNGAYQWSRRLIGPSYGWFNGCVGICAYGVANTTIAYLGAPWALMLLGITPTANAIVIIGVDPGAAGVRLGRWGLVLNAGAVAWLAFETLNIAWPRTALAPLDAPWLPGVGGTPGDRVDRGGRPGVPRAGQARAPAGGLMLL